MKIKNYKKGNVWIVVLVIMIFLITAGLAASTDIIQTLRAMNKQEKNVMAQNLAEAGVEKAIWKLNSAVNYSSERLDSDDFTTGVVEIRVTGTGQTRTVTSTAYVPNDSNPIATRTVMATLETSPDPDGIAFSYAVQVGIGGVIMQNKAKINGSVYSNGSISGSGTITGNASAVGTITGVTVNGTKRQNQPAVPLPSVDENFWINEANTNNDAISGDYMASGGNFGPRRVNGNLTLSNVTIDGPIYATGTLSLSGTITLNPNFKGEGTVIISEGAINTANPTTIVNSQDPANPAKKGHIMFYTKSSSATAVDMLPYETGGVFYAPNGTIGIQNHDNPVAVVSKTLEMKPNAELTYDTGLATAEFGVGPGGSWTVQSWQRCYEIDPDTQLCTNK